MTLRLPTASGIHVSAVKLCVRLGPFRQDGRSDISVCSSPETTVVNVVMCTGAEVHKSLIQIKDWTVGTSFILRACRILCQ